MCVSFNDIKTNEAPIVKITEIHSYTLMQFMIPILGLSCAEQRHDEKKSLDILTNIVSLYLRDKHKFLPQNMKYS